MRLCTVPRMCLGVLAATGLVLAVTGCSESEANRSVARRVSTVDTVSDVREDLIKADAQVVATQQSLDRLTNQQAGNLKDSFDQFKSDVDRSQSMSERINGRASALSTDSYEHITEWNYQARSIEDPALRQRSLDREEQARKEHDQMVIDLNDVRSSYVQYNRQLDDIRRAAAADLTPGGVANIKPQADKIREEGQQLRQKMATLDAQLNRVAQSWRTEVPLAERVRQEGAQPAAGEMPANQPADTTKSK